MRELNNLSNIIFNNFFGFLNNDDKILDNLNTNYISLEINDKIFLKIIYNIDDLASLYNYLDNTSKISNTSIDRILNKFFVVYRKIIINNIDKYIEIVILYLNKFYNHNITYDKIYKLIKNEIKAKINHTHINTIKKNLDL